MSKIFLLEGEFKLNRKDRKGFILKNLKNLYTMNFLMS